MDKEYTAEDARVLAERLEDGDLYVCSDEVSDDQDDYGYYRHYYKEQWKDSDDIVNILRKYAEMKEGKSTAHGTKDVVACSGCEAS